MPKKQVHAIFKGHVQGVGFRFIVERLAIRLGIVGWVKNSYDGDVEVVAEGDKEVLEKFFEQINQEFSNYIKDKQIVYSEATNRFKDFEIRF